MNRAEPRFDIDYAYGKQGELQIAEFLEWIAKGNGQVEIKRKRILDLHFYVETHCDKGRTGNYQPSGISVSTATAWAFVLDDTDISVIFPAAVLRAMLDDPSTKDKEETHGRCPTKGKLVSLAVLVYREKRRRELADRPLSPIPATPETARSDRQPVTRPLPVDEIPW